MFKENQTKTCKYCQEEINKKAKCCPRCGKDLRYWSNRHPVLSVIIIFIVLMILGNIFSNNDFTPKSSSTLNSNSTLNSSQDTSVTTHQKELLELLDYNCYKQRDYFITEGQVKNISGKSIESVEAVVTAYTQDGKFVKSDTTLIEYNPIMPGQISPFKVMMKDNPEIKKCKVEFKEFWGSEIPTKK